MDLSGSGYDPTIYIKSRRIYLPDEQLLVCEEGLYSMQPFSSLQCRFHCIHFLPSLCWIYPSTKGLIQKCITVSANTWHSTETISGASKSLARSSQLIKQYARTCAPTLGTKSLPWTELRYISREPEVEVRIIQTLFVMKATFIWTKACDLLLGDVQNRKLYSVIKLSING